MQVEKLNLAELKKRAEAPGYTKIQRDAEGAPVVLLASWQGFSTEAGNGFSHIAVWYRLDGNRVTVSKMGEPDVHYRLS